MSRPPALFVGRDTELAALEQDLTARLEDGPVAALVSGVAGIGKSALLEVLAHRHTGPVRRARAAAWERDEPLGVLRQLLDGDAPEATVDAARELLTSLAREPGGTALLVVDDAQWADPESLRALSTAVRHAPQQPFVVLLAAALGPDVPSATRDLLHRLASVEVPLDPLSSSQVGELAAAHGIPLHPGVAERLAAHTGGLPRDVVDVLRESPRSTWGRRDPALPAPARVGARVREAVTDCSAPARRLAEAVAVLGPGATVRAASELAEVAGSEEVWSSLQEASTAGLVQLDPGDPTVVSPADPMVRTALLAGMGPAAAATARRRAADLSDDPVERLRLLVAASTMPDASLAAQLEELSSHRAADGAWAEAASLLTDSGRLTEDTGLRENRLTRAVDALIGAGDVFGATSLVPELESFRETPLRNAVLGYLAIVRGRMVEAETRLGRAWDLVNADKEPGVAALICQRYVLHELARCHGGELVRWADRATSLAHPEDPAAIEAAAIRGLGLAATGRAAEALEGYEQLAARVRHGAQAQRISMGRGWLDLAVDAVDDARAHLETAVPTTYLGGSTRISLWAHAWLARAQFVTGDWDAALATVREGLALADRTGMVLVAPLLHWTQAQVSALRGDVHQAAEALRLVDAGGQDYEIMRVPACLARASVAEARADYAAVLRALRPLTQGWARGLVEEPGQWPWADVYANALVIEGRHDEADAFLTRHEELARARAHRSARARLGYARGRLLGARGDLRAARRSFDESLSLLEDLPLTYDRARVSFAYGQTLRRAGKRRQADAVMTAARDLYAALGAAAYVARCDRELKAGGVRARPGEREVDELTPQEQAVTALVARGMSNREVAAELFISAKTVQYHLTRVYAKLGIRSRAELAARRGPISEDDEHQ